MYHIKKDGSNNRVLILFHGTGGDAKEMIFLGVKLDPKATLIAIEGDVKQWRMNRYFIRHEDGTFDLDNLISQTEKVYTTMMELISEYKLQNKEISLVGYSNGANIIQSMLRMYKLNFKNLILLHPSMVRPEAAFVKQGNIKVFVTSGISDQYISPSLFQRLVADLKAGEMDVKTLVHQHGHELLQEELERTSKIISK